MKKTPYYVIHKDKLDNGLISLKSALHNSWPNYIIGYSYKTNALPWVIEYFKSNDCFAEVVSDDEYNLALSIGVRNDRLIYNGLAKSKDTFLQAIVNNAIVNIDAEYEVDWLDYLPYRSSLKTPYEVGIRVNFDLESKCPGQSQCGVKGERFGFCYENGELKKIIDRIIAKGARVSGIHLHKSSKTRMPDIYRAIAEAAVEIAKQYRLQLKYVDIGGGFFGGLETKPQFSEYFSLVSKTLLQYFSPEETKLIVEPGISLIGAPVDYVTSVLDVKQTTRDVFIVTDGSRTQIDPLMTKSGYSHEIIRCTEGRELLGHQTISGYTCMEHDRLFSISNEKAILPGDRIIYHKVGAYTMCLSPLFIKWFPEVYINDGKEETMIRERWSTEEYRRRSVDK